MAKRRKAKNGNGAPVAGADTAKVNKSQLIRDALAASENASPKEIAETLAQQGVKVSPAFVSMIKFKAKPAAKKPRGKKNRNNQAKGLVNADDLLEAKKLVSQVGSVTKAKEALDLLAKLNS